MTQQSHKALLTSFFASLLTFSTRQFLTFRFARLKLCSSSERSVSMMAALKMGCFALVMMMMTITNGNSQNVVIKKTIFNGSEIIKDLLNNTRFPITLAVLPPPASLFLALISGPTTANDKQEIKGSVLFLQPLSSMKAGGPLLLEGQGRLLKEVFPALVDRFEARRSSVGVMCTEESGGDCFLFMAGPGEKNQSVMFTFDLGHVNKGSEQQAPPTFCTLSMDDWKETLGTANGISHLLLPFDLPQAFFAFHNYQEGKEDHNGQLMYSRSEVKMVKDSSTIGSRCPKVTNQHFTKRFICCSSQDSADGWVSDKPCTEPWAMIDLTAAFVYGGHSYNFAAEVVFRMPLLEMLQHLEHHTAWKRVPRADFWGRWEPPPDGPTEPPPPTDYWSSTSSKGTTGHSSSSDEDASKTTDSKKLNSSSTTSGNSKLLLLILLIVVLVCALIGGAVLFCFCCSSRRKKKQEEEKSTKKKARKKKEVKSKAKNKEKSTSKPGNNSSQSSPVPKTTSFFPPSSSSAQSGSKQAPPSSSASASAAKAVASTNASLATKAPQSKVTIRSKMTTADKEGGKSLPAVEKMPSYSETSIMTDARKKNTSTSAGAGRSSQSKRQPTTRSKLSTVKK